MKTNEIKATHNGKTLGIVLKLESLAGGADTAPFSAHMVLNRLVIDDDGNICLTSPAGLHGVLDAVDDLKRELDDLGNQAVLWLAGSIASRRAMFSVVPDSSAKTIAAVPNRDGGVHNNNPGSHREEETNVVSLTQRKSAD